METINKTKEEVAEIEAKEEVAPIRGTVEIDFVEVVQRMMDMSKLRGGRLSTKINFAKVIQKICDNKRKDGFIVKLINKPGSVVTQNGIKFFVTNKGKLNPFAEGV